jgi:hypothetical protein
VPFAFPVKVNGRYSPLLFLIVFPSLGPVTETAACLPTKRDKAALAFLARAGCKR